MLERAPCRWAGAMLVLKTPRAVESSGAVISGFSTSKKINFLKDVAFPKKRDVSLTSLFEMTNFLIKTDAAHFASRSAHQDRRRAPHVPFGTTQ